MPDQSMGASHNSEIDGPTQTCYVELTILRVWSDDDGEDSPLGLPHWFLQSTT